MALMTIKELQNHPAFSGNISGKICSDFDIIEEGVFDCLGGEAVLTFLHEKLTAYPSNTERHNPNSIYMINQYVVSNGNTYISLVANNTASLSDANSWKKLEKFSEPCLNDWWCKYLFGAIGYKIDATLAPVITYPTSDMGVSERKTSTEDTNNGDEVSTKQNVSSAMYARYLKKAISWLEANYEKCGIPFMPGQCGQETCKTTVHHTRVMAFM